MNYVNFRTALMVNILKTGLRIITWRKKTQLNAFLIWTRCTTRTSYGNTVFEITADCRLRWWKGHLANEEIMNIGLKDVHSTYISTFCILSFAQSGFDKQQNIKMVLELIFLNFWREVLFLRVRHLSLETFPAYYLYARERFNFVSVIFCRTCLFSLWL